MGREREMKRCREKGEVKRKESGESERWGGSKGERVRIEERGGGRREGMGKYTAQREKERDEGETEGEERDEGETEGEERDV